MSAWDDTKAQAVDNLVARFAVTPGPLLPLLHAVQDAFGYIPAEAVSAIARGLNLSRAEVHGVISFYHYFRGHAPGRHVVQVCRAEACQAMHGERTEAHAREKLGVDWHGTTADGQFTLEAVYCLGNCALSPAVMLDGRTHGRVDAARAGRLIEAARSGS